MQLYVHKKLEVFKDHFGHMNEKINLRGKKNQEQVKLLVQAMYKLPVPEGLDGGS